VDAHLSRCETITFNAGTYSESIRMRYADYARLAEARVLDFSARW
jgi:prolyl-tRNA editing enzyme YbaK/EbsC (Cys-tRNA(Pro) deacylase)